MKLRDVGPLLKRIKSVMVISRVRAHLIDYRARKLFTLIAMMRWFVSTRYPLIMVELAKIQKILKPSMAKKPIPR